jgi:hypothetical protein
VDEIAPTASAAPAAHRGVTRLAADLAVDTSRLVRLEIALAKAEVAEQARMLGSGVATIAAGVFVLIVAFPVLVASLVLGLAEALSPWLAALLVGGLLLVLAAALFFVGAKLAQRGSNLAPTQTIESARQDLQWLQRRVTSDTTSNR